MKTSFSTPHCAAGSWLRLANRRTSIPPIPRERAEPCPAIASPRRGMRASLLVLLSLLLGAFAIDAAPPDAPFDGLGVNLGNLYRVSNAKSRSISPENFTGEKGKAGMATEGTGKNAARDLGQGWKVSPSVNIKSKTTFTLANIDGRGAIQSIWMTPTGNWSWSILRF